MIDQNATQAAIRAGYSQKSASVIGYQLLQNPLVSEAIRKLEDARFKRLQATADRVLAEWANLGFSDIGNIVWMPGELDSRGAATASGTLKPLSEMTPEVRRTIKKLSYDKRGRPEYEFWDKAPYQINLGKHHKLASDSVSVTGRLTLEQLVTGANQAKDKDE